MADTAKRLTGPNQLSTSAVTKYTVPASTTTTILYILAINTGTSVTALTISIGADAVGTRIIHARPIGIGEVFELKGYIVMTAAEILQAYASAATSLTLTINGVETT